MLKDYLNTHYSHLLHPGASNQAYKEFQAAIEEAWLAMDQSLIDGALLLMQRRVAAVVAAKGWYTKY